MPELCDTAFLIDLALSARSKELNFDQRAKTVIRHAQLVPGSRLRFVSVASGIDYPGQHWTSSVVVGVDLDERSHRTQESWRVGYPHCLYGRLTGFPETVRAVFHNPHIQRWGAALNQFVIVFGERIALT